MLGRDLVVIVVVVRRISTGFWNNSGRTIDSAHPESPSAWHSCTVCSPTTLSHLNNAPARDPKPSSAEALHVMYGINLDDKKREWRVLCDDYVQVDGEEGAKRLRWR